MAGYDRNYSNGEITVHWRPAKCIHAAVCVRSLPAVFDAARRPWVDIGAASTADIIAVVDRCPSGALSYSYDK